MYVVILPQKWRYKSNTSAQQMCYFYDIKIRYCGFLISVVIIVNKNDDNKSCTECNFCDIKFATANLMSVVIFINKNDDVKFCARVQNLSGFAPYDAKNHLLRHFSYHTKCATRFVVRFVQRKTSQQRAYRLVTTSLTTNLSTTTRRDLLTNPLPQGFCAMHNLKFSFYTKIFMKSFQISLFYYALSISIDTWAKNHFFSVY